MKKRQIFFILFHLLFVTSILGQTNTIRGKVLDKNSNKGIPEVNVVDVKNEGKGMRTDDNGFFEISASSFPMELRISHIGYEDQSLLLEVATDTLTYIYLSPKIYEIPDVSVVSKKEIKSLSEVEKYSVVDYEILDQKIVMLEYHGSFKKKRLSLFDFNANQEDLLELSGIKKIESLYKSCNGIIYVLTASMAYPFIIDNNKFWALQEIQLRTFNNFIKPCKIRSEEYMYYLVEELNGLKNTIRRFDPKTAEDKIIRILLDKELEARYLEDLATVKSSTELRSMMTNNREVNKIWRGIQSDRDFLANVFYKLEYPINIFLQQKELVVLNHPAKKIELYELDILKSEIEIAYPTDKKWLKQVIQDEKNQKLYGIFKHDSNVKVKELDTRTGMLKDIEVIDAYSYHLKKIQVFDGHLFYIKENTKEWGRRELIRHKI